MQMPLIGNRRICSMVNSMVKNRRIPHAILIEGEDGLGKKTLARYIAKSCLCKEEDPPCNACKTCHLIEVGSHPDFQVVTPDGVQIKVDRIRELRVEAFLTPMAADGRVFIIESAHTMNEAAQNALLKVLEEPPKGVTFILLAKSAKLLLETIRSRCVCFSLSPVSFEDEGISKVAAVAGISYAEAQNLLIATDGNIGRAINSANRDTVFLSGIAFELLKLAAAKDRLGILNLLQPYVKDRAKVSELIFELKSALAKEIKKKAMKELSSFTADKLNYCYSELTDIQNRMEFNPSIPLVFCRIAAIFSQ